MRVADERDAEVGGVEAQLGGQAGEHVLPDRVARGGVEEPVALPRPAASSARRNSCVSSEIVSCVQRAASAAPREKSSSESAPTTARSWLPARHDRAVLVGERDAGVRLGAVAHEVAEAPHLLGARVLGSGDHRLEGVAVAVDVSADGDLHGVASIRCRTGSACLPLSSPRSSSRRLRCCSCGRRSGTRWWQAEPRAYFSAAELERATVFAPASCGSSAHARCSSWASSCSRCRCAPRAGKRPVADRRGGRRRRSRSPPPRPRCRCAPRRASAPRTSA